MRAARLAVGALLAGGLAGPRTSLTQKPALVVLITLDQLRTEYMTMWEPQLASGLGR